MMTHEQHQILHRGRIAHQGRRLKKTRIYSAELHLPNNVIVSKQLGMCNTHAEVRAARDTFLHYHWWANTQGWRAEFISEVLA